MNDHSDLSGIAASINARIASEGRVLRALGFCWSCGGFAIGASLAGLGFALAFAGYSRLISVTPAAIEIAQALKSSLEGAEIKTNITGLMALAGNAEVKLAPAQSVRLAPATVALDPHSSVRVVGDLKLDYPQPSKEQLQLDLRTSKNELPFTTYTIFRNIPFGTGKVVTGWRFDINETRPKFQYCYFTQSIDTGISRSQTIAINGSPYGGTSASKLNVDRDAAMANCIWFSGV